MDNSSWAFYKTLSSLSGFWRPRGPCPLSVVQSPHIEGLILIGLRTGSAIKRMQLADLQPIFPRVSQIY
jgi:hypothetical protein